MHQLPDFKPVNSYAIAMSEFSRDFTVDDLREWTQFSVQALRDLIQQCEDADIVFVPDDPDAKDGAAADPQDANLAWTIGHNIVHATASAEEYAFSAAELARGVAFHGRSRYEVPWQTVTTVTQCLQRLNESERMRLASLQMWGDQPNLQIGYMPWRQAGFANAMSMFTWGLAHDASHILQISKILAQVKSVERV